MAAKVLVLYHEPTDPTAFEQYYTGTHVPLAKRLPNLRSYTVSRGTLVSPAGAPPYYMIAELTFETMDALQTALASTEGRTVARDVANFATGGATLLMYETRDV